MSARPMHSRITTRAHALPATLGAAIVLGLAAACAAQITASGNVKTSGSAQFGGQKSQYVKIYALFPPEGGTADQTAHFGPYVMSQPAIDGVTDRAIWSSVEKVTPSATPCAGPPGTDVCQLDLFGWYHIYDWSDIDSTLAYWFTFGSKSVNVIGFSQTQPPTNLATPYYVTTSSWIAHTGGVQDVVNMPKNTCTTWTGPSVQSITYAAGIATVQMGAGQVTDANGYPSSPTSDDVVWISGAGNLDTTTSGATILTVDQPNKKFTYGVTCSTGCSAGNTATAITKVQSWIVPYETPMKTAMKAFIAAAIKHFGPNHSGTTINPFQVSYMRFGKSVGGESFVYCSGGLGGTTPQYSTTVWQQYITEMTNFEQAQSPTMFIFEPINRVGSSASDPDYPNYEASDAIKHGNVYGATFGFGSQGLSLSDPNPPPNVCASNWCNLFLGNFPKGSPLELQQIANSDPFDKDCAGGCNPGGESGDLRGWLPFAVNSHMNVLELYSVDADLAYDPNFCVLTGSPCDSGSYGSLNGLTSTQQHDYFQGDGGANVGVGLGHTCDSGDAQGGANGNCDYRTYINAAHGYQ